MRRFVTFGCCLALAMTGYFIADLNVQQQNTISAEPVAFNVPQDLCRVVHDTVNTVSRDTVVHEKVVHTTTYRTRRVTDTIHHVDTVEVPVLYTRTRGNRKEISPDTLLRSGPRVTREVIELKE